MTRYLSQSLGATEPAFSQRLEQLEQASGAPSADIRLTAENMQKVRGKIAELGLDPKDTTAPELYAALQGRLRDDELRVRAALNIADDATTEAALASLTQFLQEAAGQEKCFALKAGAARKLLKNKPPKLAMKRLGYRSLDSFIKHEAAANIYAVALIAESPAWHKAFREQYAKLKPADFEQRPMQVLHPASKRWDELAASFVSTAKHNILLFKELGTAVVLPLDESLDGLAVMTLLQVLNMCNDIRTHSSFAKLQQVNPAFGKIIQKASLGEPYTSAQLAGQPVPWRMVQRYFAQTSHAYHPEIFEPHVQSEDLTWRHAEDVLAELAPALKFWQGTQSLCLIHDDGQPVSLNAMDVALGLCNRLNFGDRVVHFVRENLWHELMLRYLNHENLERVVMGQIGRDLGAAPAETDMSLALAE